MCSKVGRRDFTLQLFTLEGAKLLKQQHKAAILPKFQPHPTPPFPAKLTLFQHYACLLHMLGQGSVRHYVIKPHILAQ